jgi:hypothetical protein
MVRLDGVHQNARHPNRPNLGADRAPSGSQGEQGLLRLVVTHFLSKPIIIQTASSTNGNPLFPPPPIHPGMMHLQNLPPGSRIQNVDSYNTSNENVINVNNDNSTEHGTFIFASHRLRRFF